MCIAYVTETGPSLRAHLSVDRLEPIQKSPWILSRLDMAAFVKPAKPKISVPQDSIFSKFILNRSYFNQVNEGGGSGRLNARQAEAHARDQPKFSIAIQNSHNFLRSERETPCCT